jgi:hypothetical protein
MIRHFLFRSLLLTATAFGMRVGPLLADEEPGELVQARAGYQRDVEFATRPIRDRYLGRLESLKRSLGSRGDAKGAIAVQAEIDRMKTAASDASGIAKFAGTWQVVYDNAGTRRYAITAEGAVTWSEDNGKPIAPKKAKITAKGTEFLLEFRDEPALERLSIANGNLIVEHFNPKASYPIINAQHKAVGTPSLPNKD